MNNVAHSERVLRITFNEVMYRRPSRICCSGVVMLELSKTDELCRIWSISRFIGL